MREGAGQAGGGSCCTPPHPAGSQLPTTQPPQGWGHRGGWSAASAAHKQATAVRKAGQATPTAGGVPRQLATDTHDTAWAPTARSSTMAAKVIFIMMARSAGKGREGRGGGAVVSGRSAVFGMVRELRRRPIGAGPALGPIAAVSGNWAGGGEAGELPGGRTAATRVLLRAVGGPVCTPRGRVEPSPVVGGEWMERMVAGLGGCLNFRCSGSGSTVLTAARATRLTRCGRDVR